MTLLAHPAYRTRWRPRRPMTLHWADALADWASMEDRASTPGRWLVHPQSAPPSIRAPSEGYLRVAFQTLALQPVRPAPQDLPEDDSVRCPFPPRGLCVPARANARRDLLTPGWYLAARFAPAVDSDPYIAFHL